MTKGEKDTLINEVQYMADFFNEIQKSEMQKASVYTISDVQRMEEVFAKYLMYAIRGWIEKRYSNPKRIRDELGGWLIRKGTVALFFEAQRQEGDEDEIGKYETIQGIEHYDLGYHLGNAFKYISRAGLKSKDTKIQDLEKGALVFAAV